MAVRAHSPSTLAHATPARQVAQTLFGVTPVDWALLIVYLAGVIGTAWRLNASTANRERCSFFSIPCLIWPLTATGLRSTSLDRLAGALVRQAGYRFYGSESRYSG